MIKYMAWVLPLFVLVAIAPFSTQIDLSISSYFYRDGHFTSNHYVWLFYKYGEYIGLLVAFICGVVAIYTLLTQRFTYLTRGAFVAVITFVIGSGLITNGLFKNLWGRPRPRQIEQFGGTKAFTPFYQPNWTFPVKDDKQKSFPSGHASVGFFFLVFAIIGWRERNRLLTWLGVIAGLGMGINLSLIRIMQGGHFFTDTLASALVMWYTGLAVTYFIYDWSLLRDWS